MRPAFVAHRRTVAKRMTYVWGMMIICTSGLGFAGFECLFRDDLFAIVTGIALVSIASVGLPWSILGCLFNIQDMNRG